MRYINGLKVDILCPTVKKWYMGIIFRHICCRGWPHQRRPPPPLPRANTDTSRPPSNFLSLTRALTEHRPKIKYSALHFSEPLSQVCCFLLSFHLISSSWLILRCILFTQKPFTDSHASICTGSFPPHQILHTHNHSETNSSSRARSHRRPYAKEVEMKLKWKHY